MLVRGHDGIGGVGKSRRNVRLDKLLWSNDPRNTPTRQAEPLGEAVDNENIVLINVVNVFLTGISEGFSQEHDTQITQRRKTKAEILTAALIVDPSQLLV